MIRRGDVVACLLPVIFMAACTKPPEGEEDRVGRLSLPQVLELARNGDRHGVHQACFRYRYGEGGTGPDDGQAFRWCSKGHELGIPSSTTLLAELHMIESSKRFDRGRARALYLEAAQDGHSFAMFAYGVVTVEDATDEAGRQEGRDWLQKSADLGQPAAIEYLEEHPP